VEEFMAKVQRVTFLQSAVSAGVYQWKQGKILRRSTGGVILFAVILGGQALFNSVLYDLGSTGTYVPSLPQSFRQIPVGYWIVALFDLIGAWLTYRVINYPPFADFLIEVESEMAKVSWPSWVELQRATVVVLATMFIFSALLFGYDIAWQKILVLTRVLKLTL
jgi:preprotein translocase subunit SecE